jgi:hypothetical protein
MKDTDRDWEVLAQQEPYWAVISSKEPKFCNFTLRARKEFFETGLQGDVTCAELYFPKIMCRSQNCFWHELGRGIS